MLFTNVPLKAGPEQLIIIILNYYIDCEKQYVKVYYLKILNANEY